MSLDTTSLTFTAYMADPALVRDLEILIECGGVQRAAIAEGADNPAGWWVRAAEAYYDGGPNGDPQGRLGRRACQLAAASLADGDPS